MQVVTLANENDMYNMFGMFEVGQMAILLTTDDVFIRTRTKWKQVTVYSNMVYIGGNIQFFAELQHSKLFKFSSLGLFIDLFLSTEVSLLENYSNTLRYLFVS